MTDDHHPPRAAGEDATDRGVGSRLTALQIRMEASHAQTTRLLSLVSGLSAQVATALAEASASADGIGGRMQHVARDAEAMLARLLGATQSTNDAVAEVALRVERLGGATGEYSRRLRSDVEQYEVTTVQAIRGLETAAATVGARLVDDIAEVLTALRDAVTDTGADMAGITDGGQIRIQRMIDRLDDRINDHARIMATATDQLSAAVAELGETRGGAASASDQMAQTAANLHQMSVAALDRMAASADGLEHRVGQMVQASLAVGTAQTSADVEALSTTVAWASRSIQQVVETLTDDLASTATASVRRIEDVGQLARDRVERAVTDAESAITQEVRRSIEPLAAETSRVAEQQADLAQTIHDASELIRRREADVLDRQQTADRLEQITTETAGLIGQHVGIVEEQQRASIDQAEEIVRRLETGARRAAGVLDRLVDVTTKLEAAAAAADRARQELQAVVARAEEVAQRATARRRVAAPVPRPE